MRWIPVVHFYPRSPCGERHLLRRDRLYRLHFYPRSPCGERHKSDLSLAEAKKFLSTLSLRRATLYLSFFSTSFQHFYPRSPCGERRRPRALKSRRKVFLSTLSLRRATVTSESRYRQTSYFYPRSPCGERHWPCVPLVGRAHFYPRSPCGERRKRINRNIANGHFYPRSPCGERRTAACRIWPLSLISIHALLAESDPGVKLPDNIPLAFLSTLSLRRATQRLGIVQQLIGISIHALLAESD